MTTEEIQRLRTQAGDSATFTQLLSDPEFKAKVDRVQAGMPDMTPFEKLKFPSAMLDIHMKQPIKNTMDSASSMIDKGMTQQQDGVSHTPGRYQYDPNEGVTFSNILPTAGKMSYNFGKDAWDTVSAILSDPGEVLKNMINPVYGAAQYGIDAVVPGQIFGDTPQKKSAYDLAHAYGLPQTVGGLVDLISGKGVQGLNEISQGFSQAGTTTYENPLSTYLLGKGVKGAVSGALRGTGALGESVAGRMTAGMDSVPLDSGVARLGQASSAVGRMGQGIQNFGINNVAQGIKSAVPDVMQKPIEYVGGKAIDATSAIARSPLSVAKYGASQFSGLTPETMKTITQNSDLYGQAERGDMTIGTVADKLQSGIENRLKELSTNSKLYDEIRGSKVVVDLPDNGAQTILNKWGISYKDGKITVDPDVAKMHLEGGDITALENFMKEYGDSAKVSANKILNARQALDTLSKWGENKTDASTLIAKDLRNMYDTAAKGKIKGLDAIDTAYAPEVQLLNKLKSEYLQKQISPDGRLTYTLSEGALRKLYGSTNPFNDPQLARLRQIIPGIDSELRVIRALKDVEYAKGQKVGTYVRGAVLGGGVMSMNIPAIVTAIIMSPPVLVPLLKWYGTVRGMFSKTENILQKVKAGSPLTEEQRTVIGDAMRYYEQEATASRQGTTTPQGMPQETVGASPTTLPVSSPTVNVPKALPRDGASNVNKITVQDLKNMVEDYQNMKNPYKNMDLSTGGAGADYVKGKGLGKMVKELDAKGAFDYKGGASSVDPGDVATSIKDAISHHQGKPIEKALRDAEARLAGGMFEDVSSQDALYNGFQDALNGGKPKAKIDLIQEMIDEGYGGLNKDIVIDNKGNTLQNLMDEWHNRTATSTEARNATRASNKAGGIDKTGDGAGATVSDSLRKKFPNLTPEEIMSLTPEEKVTGIIGGSDSVGGGVKKSIADIRADKSLDVKINYGDRGGVMTRREFVDKAMKDGAKFVEKTYPDYAKTEKLTAELQAIKRNATANEAYNRAHFPRMFEIQDILDSGGAKKTQYFAEYPDGALIDTTKYEYQYAKNALPSPSPLEPLMKEARKYPTAEAFVNAQGTNAYHGTNVEFNSFDKSKLGVSTKAKSAEKGFWFVDNADVAKGYGEYASEKPVRDILDQIKIAEKNKQWDKANKLTIKAEEMAAEYADPVVIEAKLNLKNPMVYDAKGKGFLATDKRVNDLIDKAIAEGNDALIIKNLKDNVYSADIPATHTIVFNNDAILTKSQLIDLWKKANSQ